MAQTQESLFKRMLDEIPIFKTIYLMVINLALVILISGIVGLVLAFPIMLLWNFVFPFFKLTILQAWALNILTGILIGSKSNSKK